MSQGINMLLACPHAFVRMAMSNASDKKLVISEISLLQEAGTKIPSKHLTECRGVDPSENECMHVEKLHHVQPLLQDK